MAQNGPNISGYSQILADIDQPLQPSDLGKHITNQAWSDLLRPDPVTIPTHLIKINTAHPWCHYPDKSSSMLGYSDKSLN